jgi:hypothetical protein
MEASGLISGTRPTGTVLRKCVRGTPRHPTLGDLDHGEAEEHGGVNAESP